MPPPDQVQVTVSPTQIVVVEPDDAASVKTKSVTVTSCGAARRPRRLEASSAPAANTSSQTSACLTSYQLLLFSSQLRHEAL